jgi:organic hydroperoxide reductase OsmC/OhrA
LPLPEENDPTAVDPGEYPRFAVERRRDFTEVVTANTREHRYAVSVTWSGNLGSGTSGYRDYSRNYEIGSDGKPDIHGSADLAFRGDRSRWNPEELLVASLSACHKLWYLHLAAEAGVIVTAYVDRAEGVMELGRDGVGRFKSVVLRPTVTVAKGSDPERTRALHKPAHEKCFIANSVNFPVGCEPEIVVDG